MSLSMVIPAYNEEKAIATTIKKLKKVKCIDEIIVVNDCSTDKTGEILASFKNIKILTHKKNLGYGAALKTGFANAKNEYICFFDADLTYPFKMIPIMFDCLKKENLDCVWGNRFAKKENKMNPIRKIGNSIMSLLASIIFFKLIHDINCGQRVFRKKILNQIDYKSLPDDLHFITAFTKRIVIRNMKFKEIPIDYYYRKGRSKLRILKHGFLMLSALLFY